MGMTESGGYEIELRRVVPVSRRLSDGTWVVSVEVWDHGVVIRWATSEPPSPPMSLGVGPDRVHWLISDDVGTSYTRVSGGGGGGKQRGYHYDVEFEPAPPPSATSLRIGRAPADADLSISLTD